MEDPVRDDAGLYEVFDYARNHPNNWDQNGWVNTTACGTTYCLAGFKTWVLDKRPLVRSNELEDQFVCKDSSGDLISAEDYATRELGLNYQESLALFHCYTHSRVETVVKDIMNDEYRKGGSEYYE